MKKMNKILSSVAAVAVLSSASVAATVTDQGNYLVTPAYFATKSGYTTKIDIFNTNFKKAVIAKVVVREAKCSQELKDFLVFLSPGDAYTAEIKMVDGKAKIFSSDDSNDTGKYVTSGADLTKTAAEYLKEGQELLKGAVYAPAALDLVSGRTVAPANVKAAGTKLADLSIFNGETKTDLKFEGGKGYVEVFTLLELDAQTLAANFGKTWTEGKPLAKSYMVEFYDAISKRLHSDSNGINFGTRALNFANYTNKPDNLYAPILKAIDTDTTFKNSAGNVWDIDAILNVDAVAPTGVDADYIEKIDKNLLTGTVTIKNTAEGKEAAMTTPMYSYNIESTTGVPLLTNRVFGERQAETNYRRVLNGDAGAANMALKGLIEKTNSDAIYIPYTKGKPSLLNTLFLGKNLSNYKCLTKLNSSNAVQGITRQAITYKSAIRDMSENLHEVVSKENPFSGYYQDSGKPSSLWPELGQLQVSKILEETPTGYNSGWITVNFLKSVADGAKPFAYDVNEQITDSAIAPYTVKNGTNGYNPAVLPSYMQVIGTSAGKTYTNMYRPAVR